MDLAIIDSVINSNPRKLKQIISTCSTGIIKTCESAEFKEKQGMQETRKTAFGNETNLKEEETGEYKCVCGSSFTKLRGLKQVRTEF